MTTQKSYVIVDSSEKTRELAKYILESDVIAFDIETDSLNTRKGQIIGFSVTSKVGTGYYYPTMIYANGKLVENGIEGSACHGIAKKLIEMLIGKKIIGHKE
jgi:DNA polymerase I-like protein with 3'-5' exonuclease and polymerase domains